MLVLSRKKSETILIGDDVEVMVVELRGDKVRIGVSAPRDVSVDRSEVREAKRRGVEPPPVGETSWNN